MLAITRRANHLADVGEIESAERLYREALELNRALYRTDHPDVAFAIDNLAMVVHDQGDYDEARKLYFESLAMLRRIYGEEHPEIAQTLDNVLLPPRRRRLRPRRGDDRRSPGVESKAPR